MTLYYIIVCMPYYSILYAWYLILYAWCAGRGAALESSHAWVTGVHGEGAWVHVRGV